MNPAYYHEGKIILDGQSVRRLMLVLRTNGCEYAKNTGGCSVCGFMNHASHVSHADLLSQTEMFGDFEGVDALEMLTLGSFYNDNEIEPATRQWLIKFASGLNIKKLTVESRVEHIQEDLILDHVNILGNIRLEIGIGLESVNDVIRNQVINKGLSLPDFKRAIKKISRTGASLLVYILIKPPGLSEEEAIDDAVKSAEYVFSSARKYNLKARVAFEPVFVCKGTHLDNLYKNGEYEVLNLWSVVEVIKQTHKLGDIFVGLDDEGLSYGRRPRSCKKCNDWLKSEIEQYNISHDISRLEMLGCDCR